MIHPLQSVLTFTSCWVKRASSEAAAAAIGDSVIYKSMRGHQPTHYKPDPGFPFYKPHTKPVKASGCQTPTQRVGSLVNSTDARDGKTGVHDSLVGLADIQ